MSHHDPGSAVPGPHDDEGVPASVDIDTDDARPRRWGWLLLLAGFGGALLWASLAPLDAGVSTRGTVVVAGGRQLVQPLATGKVVSLRAQDGDTVRSGQELVLLDTTQSRAQWEVARAQWLTALATEARLQAERTHRAARPAFPVELTAQADDTRARSAMQTQEQLYVARKAALEGELSAMSESIRGVELQAKAVEDSHARKHEQLRLLRQQLVDMRGLADEGYLARNRVLDQERTLAVVLGALAEDDGALGRHAQVMAETRERMTVRRQEFLRDVETQLADVQRDLSSLRSRIESLQFEVDHASIRAPVTGTVINRTVHTVGGVVSAGNVLMEIVPADRRLLIEAQVAPHLIDKLKPGLPVDILFPAFSQVVTPRVPGVVTLVAADVQTRPTQDLAWFPVMVEVTTEGLEKLKRHEIRSGMPAEVFIRTGERTAMNYIMKPLLDRLHHAMTEP